MSKIDLVALRDQLLNNPDDSKILEELSSEELAALNKMLVPTGNLPDVPRSYANISVFNLRERFHQRLITTGLIGFVYRLLEEYEPEDEHVQIYEKYGDDRKTAEYHCNVATENARRYIRDFLDRSFCFNPDKHVRSASSDGGNALKPVTREELIDKYTVSRKHVDPKSLPDPVESQKFTYQEIVKAINEINDAIGEMTGTPELGSDNRASTGSGSGSSGTGKGVIDIEDCVWKLRGIRENLKELQAELVSKGVADLTKLETRAALRVIPPADVYYHFNRYFTNHYEEIREITSALYLESPNMDNAVIYYSSFNTEEEAHEFNIKHAKNFIADVLTVSNEGVIFIGPFKKNIENMRFHEKSGQIYQEMMKQLEADQKLGQDIIKKKVTNKKRLNILKDGPDAKGLALYAQTQNQIAELGAKKLLSEEDMRELEALKKKSEELKEDLLMPENAVRVDTFVPDKDGKIQKTHFYTQAEAPLHMQKDSEFVDKYQPLRKEGEKILTASTNSLSRKAADDKASDSDAK